MADLFLCSGPLYEAGSAGGGYAKVPGYYRSKGTVGAGAARSQSGHGYVGLGYQDPSAVAPPPGYGAGSTPDSSKCNLNN